jgi:hypothetical protein
MPSAVRTFPVDLNPPLTSVSLRDGLRDALIAMGFPPPLKSYATTTDQFCVWQLDLDTTKTFGRAFYRLRVNNTTLGVTHAVGSGWTDASNTLANPCADTHNTNYVSNIPLQFWGFVGEEFKLLSISQGTTQQLLGYFRFADAPAFNEVSFPKIFIPSSSDVATVASTGLTPYSGTALTTSLLQTLMQNADPYLQQRSQVTGIFLFGPSNSGIVARSNDDLSMGACTGMTRGDIFQIPGSNPLEQFILLRPGAGAMLIRI